MNPDQDIRLKVSQSIIANQIAMNFNQEIKHTGYYKSKLKEKLFPAQLELIKAEREEFENLFGKAEVAARDVYAALEVMITEIAELGICEAGHVTAMIRAYKKDHKSITGIVNKINNAAGR